MADYVPFEERYPERFAASANPPAFPKSKSPAGLNESKESARLKTAATVAIWVWVCLGGFALLLLLFVGLMFLGFLGVLGHVVSQVPIPIPPHP